MRTQLGRDSESMELRPFPSSLTLKLSQTDAENSFFYILSREKLPSQDTAWNIFLFIERFIIQFF